MIKLIKKPILVIFLMATSWVLLFFQNCAPAFNKTNVDNSYLAQLKKNFPSVSSVEPAKNAYFENNELICTGECTVSVTGAPATEFPNIQCGGDLRISSDQIYCGQNLVLSK